jgi:hypothetical protein
LNLHPKLFQDCRSVDLIDLKDKLKWNAEVDQTFETLKKAFTTTHILTHPDFQKLLFLETDAFDFALGVILS